MALLEKELGVRVLERSRHGAALTDYGALLVRHAQALTSLLARAADEVHLKKQGLEGRLSVGASPLACVTLVPDAVAQISGKSPNFVVQIFERSDDMLIHGLRTGEFDVVVSAAGPLADPPDVSRERLMSDKAIVMVRRQHPLARRKSIALKDLRDAQWVLPNAQTAMWRHIEALFAAENEPWPTSYVTTDSMLALRSLIARTDSVTMSSPHLLQLELAAGQLAGIPLHKSHFMREIVLRTRSGQELSPLAQRFVVALRAEAAARTIGLEAMRARH
jgi:DNA-binding transcriptional LysR family regulator